MRKEERRLKDALHFLRNDLKTGQNDIAVSNRARDEQKKCAHREQLVHLKVAKTRQIFIQDIAQR